MTTEVPTRSSKKTRTFGTSETGGEGEETLRVVQPRTSVREGLRVSEVK